jgi:hypothetical protein
MSDDAASEGELVLAHHHPGRLRVRSRAFEHDGASLEGIERWLTDQPGVRLVRAHAGTGSILLLYDPATVDGGELLAAVADRSHLAIAEPEQSASPVQKLFDAARSVDDMVLQWSGGRWGLGFVIPATMWAGAIGSFLFSAHRRAPRWDNLLYWGVQLFRSVNDDPHFHRRRHAGGGD